MSNDLQSLADKVVISNATGYESLFLQAVSDLLAGVRALRPQSAATRAAEPERATFVVTATPDPRGVHVAVHQGQHCVHAEVVALPAASAEPAWTDELDRLVLQYGNARADEFRSVSGVQHAVASAASADLYVKIRSHIDRLAASAAAQAQPEFFVPHETLRWALVNLGIAAPEANEEIGADMDRIARRIIEAVATQASGQAQDAARGAA